MNTSKIILCTVLACIYACVAQAQYKYTVGYERQRGTHDFNNSIYSRQYTLMDKPQGFALKLPEEYGRNALQYGKYQDYSWFPNALSMRLRLEVAKPNNWHDKYSLSYQQRSRDENYVLNGKYYEVGKLLFYTIAHTDEDFLATMGKTKELNVFNKKRLHLKVGLDAGIGGMWQTKSVTQASVIITELRLDTTIYNGTISIQKYVEDGYRIDYQGKAMPHVALMLSVPLSVEFDVTKRIGVSVTLTQSYMNTYHFQELRTLTRFIPYVDFFKSRRQSQMMFGFGVYYKFNDK